MPFLLLYCFFAGFATTTVSQLYNSISTLLQAIRNSQHHLTMKSKLNVAIVRHRTVVTKRLHLFLKRYEKVEDLKPLVRLLTFMSYLYFLFLASIVWLLTIGNNQSTQKSYPLYQIELPC